MQNLIGLSVKWLYLLPMKQASKQDVEKLIQDCREAGWEIRIEPADRFSREIVQAISPMAFSQGVAITVVGRSVRTDIFSSSSAGYKTLQGIWEARYHFKDLNDSFKKMNECREAAIKMNKLNAIV